MSKPSEDFLNTVDPLAIQMLARLNTPGTNDFVFEMIAAFLAKAPLILTQLEDSLRAQDRAKIYGLAHNFKSVAASVGAKAVASLAEEIESRATEKTWDLLAAKIAVLEQAFSATRIELLKINAN